jgi:hypothetical protein
MNVSVNSASGTGVRHVVLFTWAQGTTSEQIAELCAGLARLPGLVPEIADYRFGADLGINQGNAQFAVVADFASAQDYLTYRDHPDHRQLIADLVTPIVANRVAIQFAL